MDKQQQSNYIGNSYITEFNQNKTTKFSILHLNVSTLLKNLFEINSILNSDLFDIVTLNETKLDETAHKSFYKNNRYDIIRRDKTRKEGGLLVFIKKIHKLITQDTDDSNRFQLDFIYYQLQIDKRPVNFITCYKAPLANDLEFLNEL